MKHLIIILTALVLIGCGTTKDVTRAAFEARYIGKQISSGQVKENLNKIDLTTIEEQIITHALNEVALFRKNWGVYINNPSKVISINPHLLEEDYYDLKERYTEVFSIVARNWNKYDRDTQNTFINYHKHAVSLDESVQGYLEQKEFRDAMKSALNYGFTALQLIASLK